MAKERGLTLRGNIYHMQVGTFRGSCNTSDLRLARKIRGKKVGELAENKHLDIKREEKIKFKEFAPIYLNTHCKINNKGWKQSDWVYLNPDNKNGLVAYFGEYYLYEITPLMIEKFKAKELERGINPATINRTLGILSGLFHRAIDWEKCTVNPMKKVSLVKLINTRLRYFEKEEIKSLIQACIGKLRSAVIIALYTGMRRGEILRLTWPDIDFVKGLICLMEQKNGQIIPSYFKINAPMKKALMVVERNPKSQLLFCYDDGRPMNFTRGFTAALKMAGIKDASFHTLRHTFASHLAMSGVDLNTIRELMRHGSLKMTMIYAHLSKDHKSRAMDVYTNQMDSIWPNITETTQLEKMTEKMEFEKLITPLEIDS